MVGIKPFLPSSQVYLNNLQEHPWSKSSYLSTDLCRSVVSDSATPWTVTHQAPLSMGFSRPEYWNGLSFPSLGDLPDSGTEPRSPALQADSLPSEPPRNHLVNGHEFEQTPGDGGGQGSLVCCSP